MTSKLKFSILLTIFMLGMTSINAQNSETAVAITLERTACHGTCPVYTVSILENGTVVYRGEDFVEVTAEQTIELDPEMIGQMVEVFATAGYFDWDEAYMTQTVSDLPTIITSVSRNGETHHIERYVGDYTAPLALPFLENWIDEMTNTQLWTGVQPDLGAISNGTDIPFISCSGMPVLGLVQYTVSPFSRMAKLYTRVSPM